VAQSFMYEEIRAPFAFRQRALLYKGGTA